MTRSRRLGCAALALATLWFGSPAQARNTRVDWRRSMLCGSLLNAVKSSVFVPSTERPPTARPGDIVLANETFAGPFAVRRFAGALDRARVALNAQSSAARSLRTPTSVRNYVHRLNLSRMYVSDAIAAFGGFYLTAITATAVADVAMHAPDRLFALAHFVALLAAAGSFDYPVRWLASYELGMTDLTKRLGAFERGDADRFEWTRTFDVSQDFVNRLRIRPRVTWEDLHAENEREETPGAWRYFKYRHDAGRHRYRVTLEIEADRPAAHLGVRLIARPLARRRRP